MDERQRRRGADATTAIILAVALSKLVLSALVVYWVVGIPIDWLTGIPATVILLLWLAGGGLLFLPAAEGVLARLQHRARPATTRELEVLWPAWSRVCKVAAVEPSRYSMWIEDSRHINAFATSGHVVAVTREALATAHGRRLEAILAHELGHHMHGHTWALSLMSYYSTPAELFLRLILRMAASSCGCLIGWPILILALTTVGVLFYTFPPFALALVAWPIAIAAGRAGEFQADDYARRLGYGPELLIMLRELQDAGEDNDRLEFGLLSRVYSSHPPIYKRIQRIETSGHKPTAFG